MDLIQILGFRHWVSEDVKKSPFVRCDPSPVVLLFKMTLSTIPTEKLTE